nr:nicotinate-nucleotide adenylyltransferase [Parvularcula dongshanensis]
MPRFAPEDAVGLFGGSFNPAHGGHLAVAEAARRACNLRAVVWLVSPGNPLKAQAGYLSLPERTARVRAMTKGRPAMIASDAEARLGTRYTVDTVAALAGRHPGVRFVWIMGADSLASFHRWRHWRRIANTLPLLVVSRPGQAMPALTSPSAHALRQYRLREADVASLPRCRPPAWAYLPAVHDARSATEIRRREASSC